MVCISLITNLDRLLLIPGYLRDLFCHPSTQESHVTSFSWDAKWQSWICGLYTHFFNTLQTRFIQGKDRKKMEGYKAIGGQKKSEGNVSTLKQSNCGQDCCLLKCWITSHWKTKYAMGNNLILGKGKISVQQILKTFFRRFIKYSSRSCRRNQFTSL
ncbi:uncharacterized protein LOC113678983 isoform X1 [Pocillopora damicornis]|uniref:uncharacterized protein LOC113678983 isoform X1 n=1 Tax=Pocillopora damicornis TaxID=46731 RepID=UPI000F5506E1|nr:uncharacterized protein LOC113678983 isoform X1 [Pocillopora damicornis]